MGHEAGIRASLDGGVEETRRATTTTTRSWPANGMILILFVEYSVYVSIDKDFSSGRCGYRSLVNQRIMMPAVDVTTTTTTMMWELHQIDENSRYFQKKTRSSRDFSVQSNECRMHFKVSFVAVCIIIRTCERGRKRENQENEQNQEKDK